MAYNAEKITSFKDLRTWQKARELAVMVYKLTESFPDSERFGLTSQVRRSAVSVAANIAEGFSRGGYKDKVRFYAISLGSLTETLSHLLIANDLNFIKSKELTIIEEKVETLHKMTNGLIKNVPRRDT